MHANAPTSSHTHAWAIKAAASHASSTEIEHDSDNTSILHRLQFFRMLPVPLGSGSVLSKHCSALYQSAAVLVLVSGPPPASVRSELGRYFVIFTSECIIGFRIRPGTEPVRPTPRMVEDMDTDFLEKPDPVSAIENINERLKESVVEGDLEVLPQLYTQRAVWRMNSGQACEAKSDLRAALRSQLTNEAKMEICVLTVYCCRSLKDDDGETEAVTMLRECIRAGSVSSALLLKEVLACIHGSTTNAPENERLSVASSDGSVVQTASNPPPKSTPVLEPTPSTSSRDTRTKTPTQERKKGIASGFLAAASKSKSKVSTSVTQSTSKDTKAAPALEQPASPVPHKENAKPFSSPSSAGATKSKSSNGKNVSKYGSTTIEEVVEMVEESIESGVTPSPSAVDPTELDRILSAKPRFLQDVPIHEQQQLAQVMGASSALVFASVLLCARV